MPMYGMKGTREVLDPRKAPKSFKEAFTSMIANRAGVKVSSLPFRQEDMDRELQKCLRLDGHSGDAEVDAPDMAGPPRDQREGTVWSEDAEELMQLIQKLGPRSRHITSEYFLKPFFRHLCLPELSIRELDDDIARFSKLTFLDVSRNGLTCIDNLPPNLKILKAYNNPLSRVSCKPAPSLAFFGAGHSHFGSEGLEQVARRFKNLLSLDIGFSEVGNISELITPLGPLQRLRHLYTNGSPVCVLPFYRLQTLRWLTQLSVLDGAPVTDEEQVEAQALASAGTPAPGRSTSVRLGFQLQKLTGARMLLEKTAEQIVAAKRAAAAAAWAEAAAVAAAAGEETPPQPEADAEEQDPIVEACAGGALKVRIQLPDGEWARSNEVALDATIAAAWAAAAVAAGEEPTPTFDNVSLKRLRTQQGEEALFFEVGIGEIGSEVNGEVLQEDGLVRLCQWIRKGVPIKFFFRPPLPPAEQQECVAAQAAPPAVPTAEGEAAPTEEDAAEDFSGPQEVDIGGCVLGLGAWLCRVGTDVPEEVRAASPFELPDVPAPWRIEVPEVRVVPAERWLEPEVQVPPPKPTHQRKAASDGDARLSLLIDLFAGEPPPLEEEPQPPAPDPKGKKK